MCGVKNNLQRLCEANAWGNQQVYFLDTSDRIQNTLGTILGIIGIIIPGIYSDTRVQLSYRIISKSSQNWRFVASRICHIWI